MEVQMDKNILLVDDEMLIGLSSKKNLEKFGYTVSCASSGAQALEIIRQKKEISLILMDIDLGERPNGIETCTLIQKEKEIPVVFVSSHTEPEVISLTETVTSYGYIVKSSHYTGYDASIKMAYKLFNERKDKINYLKYLEIALENATEPIFITDNKGDIVFFNKAYLLIQGLNNPDLIERKFDSYKDLILVFSDDGNMLEPDDWASTRGIAGKSGNDVTFFVYHKRLKIVLVNKYTYAPIYDELNCIIGSYVKIRPKTIEDSRGIINKIIKEYGLEIV